MVGLVEGVDDGLPVGPHPGGAAVPLVLPVEAVGGEDLGQLAEVVHERPGAGVEVDEHPVLPLVDEDGLEGGVLVGELAVGLALGDVLQLPVEIPRPEVVGALQRFAVAAAGLDAAAPVGADVVVGPQPAVLGPDDDDRPVADHVLVEVARIGDVGVEAGQLPGARPQPLELQPGELGAGVARGVDQFGRRRRALGLGPVFLGDGHDDLQILLC